MARLRLITVLPDYGANLDRGWKLSESQIMF